MTGVVQRMREALSRTVAGECPGDEAFAESYPGLHEFLGLSKLPDGSPRARSKLTVFYDGPVFKASLTEPDSECSAFVTSESFLGVLAALEDAIQSDSLDWRRWWTGTKPGRSAKRG